MDIGAQELIEGGIDQAMTGEGGEAAKRLGDDPDPKVSPPVGGPRVSRMPMTLVDHLELERCEALAEHRAQPLDTAHRCGIHGGAASSAGRALPLSHTTCGIMKSIIATMMPNTLKLTHTLSSKLRAT